MSNITYLLSILKMKNITKLFLVLMMSPVLIGFCVTKAAEKPNIIIIYTDDMGIGDMSCSGGKVEKTPNIDKLAAEGKMFTNYYTTAPVCSPSRVGVTTGMYHIRWNINTFLNSKKFNANCEQSNYLNKNAPTIARALHNAGYTTAHFGKWHMGGGRDVKNAPSIAEYGFDAFNSTYESPNPDPLLTSSNWIWAPGDSIKRWERTAYFVDKTLRFLEKNDGPCFINLWPDDVHTPWVPDEPSQEAWKQAGFTLPKLQPVMKDFDIQIGRLMEGLKAMGKDKNTLVIFTSDNGPSPSFERLRTNNLRGTKNSIYEGGILMPFIVHWPSKVKAGQVDSTSILASIDLFPTLCKIAGAKTPENYQLDGEDVSKTFTSDKSYQRKNDLFFEYGRNSYYNYPKGEDRSLQLAVRRNNWKLFTNTDGSLVELYDLATDPTESKNVANENSALVKELKTKLLAWFRENDKAFLSGENN